MFTWLGMKLGEKHDWKVFNEYLNNPNKDNYKNIYSSTGLFYGTALGFLADAFLISNIIFWIRVQIAQVGL